MYDFAVIGAGIVGLTLAREILRNNPHSSILIVESNTHIGSEATSHNSGVVHAGIYYEPLSARAKLSKEGTSLLSEFCDKKGIAIEFPGKLVVATEEKELERLTKLFENAKMNGCTVRWMKKEEINETENRVRGEAAILSPRSGVVNYSQVAAALGLELKFGGAEIRTDTKVSSLKSLSDENILITSEDGEEFLAKKVIVAAGHSTLKLAWATGLGENLSSLYFKGVYRHLAESVSERMIYPTPNPKFPFLGVHITNHIDGTTSVGPNSQISLLRGVTSRQGRADQREILSAADFAIRHPRFAISEVALGESKSRCLREVRKFVPDAESKLLEGDSFYGVRHQLVESRSKLVRDYLIQRNRNMVFVLNTPSPAATSAFALANYIYTEFLSD